MVHKKRLLAAAVAAAAGLPAFADAQTSNVVLYGRFYPEMVVTRGHGSTGVGESVSTIAALPTAANGNTGNIYGVEATNSRFGIRGEESLGGGMKAIFQLESTVPVDAGGGTLGTRDTFVGLESETWGTVRLGNFDTVYKQIGDTLSFLGISSGNFVSNSNTLSKSTLGTNSAGSFHLRRANSVQYNTPDYRGFQLLVDYSPDEVRNTTPGRNAYLFSGGLKYENGPLYAALAYERHRDTFGGSRNVRANLSNFADNNARSKDEAYRGTLRYEWNALTLEVDASHLQFRETGGQIGRFQEYKYWTWSVGGDYRLGPWRFAASYAHADDGDCSLFGGAACNSDGLTGNQANLGFMYSFSRRTGIFAIASWLNNGKSARLVNSPFVTPTPGTDQDSYAVGILHNF